MKLRRGFVSNSSSSSFVCIGFKVDNTEDNFMLYGDDVLSDDYSLIVGHTLEDNEYEFSGRELSLEEIQWVFENVSKKYNKDISEIRLYTGTRAC